MDTRSKHEASISLAEAVETLSNLAELNDLYTETDETTRRSVLHKRLQWLEEKNIDKKIDLIKEIFKIILNHLRAVYHDNHHLMDNHTLEGINSIMALVGEAAKKIDETDLHPNHITKKITELDEYKKLQDFYMQRVVSRVEESRLSEWIFGLINRIPQGKKVSEIKAGEEKFTKRIFIELDSVKKDTEYELFFMRKSDGTRFFSPRLIRNIMLISNFETHLSKEKGESLLADIKLWEDYSFHVSSKNILQFLGDLTDQFYHEATKYKERELVADLNTAIMALMLSANPDNLLTNNSGKSCFAYFQDFQFYLRQALTTREYQRLIAYALDKSDQFAYCLINTIDALCYALFASLQGMKETIPHIRSILNEAHEEISYEHVEAAKQSKFLWNRLSCDYAALLKIIRRHQNGPIKKVLKLLNEGLNNAFDVILQGNLPENLYSFYANHKRIANLRIPCPTQQEFVLKARVTEEFKNFLRTYERENNRKKHLLINLQDHTSWKEHSRCEALEELQNLKEFSENLTVVTMPCDTEFYHQAALYATDNHYGIFVEHFKEHLFDEGSGYVFPKAYKDELFAYFTEGIIDTIHRVFFSGKNVLTVEQRQAFISIFYLFMSLKLIELAKPDSFSFVCKDGIDLSSVVNVEFFVFHNLLTKENMTDPDLDLINLMLYTPALMHRERIILPDCFNRMISTLKAIESIRQELGWPHFAKTIQQAFRLFYDSETLKLKGQRD